MVCTIEKRSFVSLVVRSKRTLNPKERILHLKNHDFDPIRTYLTYQQLGWTFQLVETPIIATPLHDCFRDTEVLRIVLEDKDISTFHKDVSICPISILMSFPHSSRRVSIKQRITIYKISDWRIGYSVTD